MRGGSDLTVNSGTQSATAGTYGTLAAGGTGTLNLGPGVYTITTSFTNQSIGTINGTGVTIYLCPGAGLNLGGSSSTTLSSPTGSSGFVIFDDSAGPFNTVGVTTNLVGAIYARLADLNLQNLDVQGDVVAHTVSIQSQGVVRITSSSQKQSPTITTLLSTSSVAVGGSVNDTAALNGATPDAGGTVTYSVYSNNECTGTSRDAGTVTVTNGNVPPSSSLTFSTPGTVYWRAVYSGDAKNNGASSVCTSEQLVVGRGTPSLTTTAFGPVTVGSAIHDTAHLSGGFAPLTGTITFDVYDSTCSTKLTTVAATAAVNGAGDYVSANYQPAAAGTYKWVAHYSGDGNNNKVDTTCGAEGETSTVNATGPSIATTLSASSVSTGATVHDSATLTGVTGTAGGTVTYTVYANNACSGTGQDAGTKAVTNGVPADSNALVFNTAGDFYWQAVYSGDQNNGRAVSPCTSEHLVVTSPPSGGGGGGGGGSSTPTPTPTPPTPTVVATTPPVVPPAVVTVPAPKVTPKPAPKVTPKPKPKAKFKPPKVQKPAPQPVCYTVTAAPKGLTVGKASQLQLQVHGKQKPIAGVKIAVKGAGLQLLSGPTNSAGKVTVTVHPKKPGIVSFRTAHQTCSTTRVGVASVFTPPVTG